MRTLNLLRWAGALVLAISLSPERADAQDSLSITGTFRATYLEPTVGVDLAGVYANGNNNWWKLTLNGVSYSHHSFYQEDEFGAQYYEDATRVHATSFTVEFYGPDAAILNQVVSSQLTRGGLSDGAILELVNAQYFDGFEWGAWASWSLQFDPSDPTSGVRFGTTGYAYWFDTNESGYPLVQPQRLSDASSQIDDFRPGHGGYLYSYPDIVDIGSEQQPLPPLQVAIADASKPEGDKGASTLLMTVTLNRASDQPVTVSYRTFDGTALVSNKDYVSTLGTLTFQPGQTSKTIAVTINGDRRREPNETFTMQLSNAVGANLIRWVGTATIVNDD